MSLDCVFCSIVDGVIPATIIKESEDLIVIKDRAPKAPIHYLIIPKKHLESLNSFQKDDLALAGNIILMSKDLASELNGNNSFKLVFNNGFESGQRVFHSHAHFLAGKDLSESFAV